MTFDKGPRFNARIIYAALRENGWAQSDHVGLLVTAAFKQKNNLLDCRVFCRGMELVLVIEDANATGVVVVPLRSESAVDYIEGKR